MPNGIIIIDKPQGWTSMDVCAKLRGIFREKRIGAVEFADKGEKEYVAGLKLGLVTNTQDTSGEVLEQHPSQITPEQLEAVLPQFRGDILQVPPMFSAIKINGKKLYELARKGREVERPARPVTIHSLTVEAQPAPDEFTLRVRCSKGCGGCMSSLRRTMAAGFTLEQSLTLEQVMQANDPAALLLPVAAYFSDRPELQLNAALEKKVRNGMTVVVPQVSDGEYRVYGAERGEFLALCRAENGKLTTIKSFFEV